MLYGSVFSLLAVTASAAALTPKTAPTVSPKGTPAGLYTSEGQEKLRTSDGVYQVRRQIEFKGSDVFFRIFYADSSSKTTLLSKTMQAKLISLKPTNVNERAYDLDVKVVSSTLTAGPKSPLAHIFEISACAPEHKAVDLTKASCGTFKRETGVLYSRILLEDDRRILISDLIEPGDDRPVNIYSAPLIKTRTP